MKNTKIAAALIVGALSMALVPSVALAATDEDSSFEILGLEEGEVLDENSTDFEPVIVSEDSLVDKDALELSSGAFQTETYSANNADSDVTGLSQTVACGFTVGTRQNNVSYKSKITSFLNSDRGEDGSIGYSVYFLCSTNEDWLDENVQFVAEDVTPPAYRKIYEALDIDNSLSLSTSSAQSYIDPWLQGNGIHVSEPYTPDGGGEKNLILAQGGKLVTVRAGAAARIIKVSAVMQGEVLDCVYLGASGEDGYGSSYVTCDYDEEIYTRIRHYIESQLWTDDMTNLEKLQAAASYIKTTAHYPRTTYVSEEYNPTFWANWSVDGLDLFYNIVEDSRLNHTMRLQGGIGTCTSVGTISEMAQDIGMTYLYDGETIAEGEGIYLAVGSESSNPSVAGHESLIYIDPDGGKHFIDAQGMGIYNDTEKAPCEVHDCLSKIIPLNFTNMADCSVSVSTSYYTYDGTAKTPSVVVKDGSTTLVEGIDYEVSFSDNVNAGRATVTITGIGDCIGTTTTTFDIARATLAKTMFVVDTTDAAYTGQSVTKAVYTPLESGNDYVITYLNNTKTGVATVVFTGIGNYVGEVSYDFTITDALTPFFDVLDSTAYYYGSVYYMNNLGAITGYNETTFGVGDSMTRAQLVTILWRYCEPDEYASYNEATAKNTSGLPDVPDSQYYTEAVNWAVSHGVITGYDSHIFAPNDPVTFDQMVTILARYVLGFDAAESYNDSILSNSRFTDGAAVEDWARGSMAWAIDNNVVTGNDNSNGTYTIAPLDNVARERGATVLARSIQSELIMPN